MKKNKVKHSIYLRIFTTFLAVYIVLMIGFSLFIVSIEKENSGKEFVAYASEMSKRIEDIINNSLDYNNSIDITMVKRELARNGSPIFMLPSAEVAIFTSDYNLIYNTNDYWRCTYRESKENNTSYNEYGLLNPKEWFSEVEVTELEYYLNAKPQAKKSGDIDGYSLHIDGWIDGAIIIPDKIYVNKVYAEEFDKEGNVTISRGTISYGNVYSTNYQNTKGLPYIKHGLVLQNYDVKLNNTNQYELRQMVIDKSYLKNYIEQLPKVMNPVERVGIFTYRYYTAAPYQFIINSMNEGMNSKLWIVVGLDINMWKQISSTFVYVLISCLMIFIATAYFLSEQTYKIYLKQKDLDIKRKEMTDAFAHDLKTPLSIISGYAQNLQEEVHTEKREHYASHIQANVNRMDTIIRKMLEVSKLDSDSFKIKYENLSLNAISTAITNRYKSICDEKSITVYINGESVINGDKALIERVIDNFFVNALNNMHEGGIIHIMIKDNIFEIYNSGSTISEDILDDIWLPYKKGNMERSTKGSGLGLSIVRTILELHKFTYGVINKEDGVIFWFKFK